MRMLTRVQPFGRRRRGGPNPSPGAKGWLVRALPWTVSLGLHLLLALAAGVTIIAVRAGIGQEMEPVQTPLSLGQQVAAVVPPVDIPSEPRHEGFGLPPEPPPPRELPQPGEVAAGAIPVGGALVRPGSGGASTAPVSHFFGVGGQADQVVFVIDCSGSMIETFDEVRREVLVSISRLGEGQSFHVILFAASKAYPAPAGQLVPSTRSYKLQAAEFLMEALPQMSSDPIPALRLAFEALDQAGPGKKLIYLLTDGVFPDNDRVIRMIQQLNRHHRVAINTFLYTDREGPAIAVMQRIADENRGQFKVIQPRE